MWQFMSGCVVGFVFGVRFYTNVVNEKQQELDDNMPETEKLIDSLGQCIFRIEIYNDSIRNKASVNDGIREKCHKVQNDLEKLKEIKSKLLLTIK